MREGTGSYSTPRHILVTKKCIDLWISLHRPGRKGRPHMFPLEFDYRKAAFFNRFRRKDRTQFYWDDRVASDVRIV